MTGLTDQPEICPPEICKLSAAGMAARIRAGRLSAREAVEAHLAWIERVNPGLNAIVTLTGERAMEAARRADELQARGEPIGPLHGLPTAHKDLQPTAGVRTTFGSRIFRDFVPREDSALVARIRDAGAIMIGKTNTPEFGAGSQTFNEVFGATLNPWDRTKTCGGSSGGAAVAVACGMVPLADGTDLGASLRNPASFCGVVGFRPSIEYVPPAMQAPFNVEGPIARSVADVAFFLAAIAGWAQPLERDFKGVRVAWWRDLGGIPVDSEVRRIVDAQRRIFDSAGCIVEEAEPDFTGADDVFRTLRFHSTAFRLGAHAERHPELIKDTILREIEQGKRLTPPDVTAARHRHAELRQRMSRFMERYEFFVLPVSQVPPFPVAQPYPTEIEGVKMETYIDWFRSCYYISVMGTPAVSVPCGFTADGLPVGIQIVGRQDEDWNLLRMARAFELARGNTYSEAL